MILAIIIAYLTLFKGKHYNDYKQSVVKQLFWTINDKFLIIPSMDVTASMW